MPDGRTQDGSARPDGTVTWRQLLADVAEQRGDRNEARWMCEVASGRDRGEFAAELDQRPTSRMVAHLDAMLARRRAGEPLQYVLGAWQFRRIELMVDRRVLIPRPETEWVCEVALGIARALREAVPSGKQLSIVDLGTGSGAIGLSLADELPIGSATVWLTDLSLDALDVARANLAGLGRAGAAVKIGHGAWFAALPIQLRGTLDLVVANPPYIASGDTTVDREVSEWEPHSALFAGNDGLRDVRVIVSDAISWLRPGGWLVLEIGDTQGPAVTALLRDSGYTAIEVRPDLTGRDRIGLGRRPSA